MTLLSPFARDWHRYGIRNCEFPQPLPLGWLAPHKWVPTTYFVMSWDWDLGHVAIGFEPGYESDGASIPMLAGSIVDPVLALPGSQPHDKLYETCAGVRPYRVRLPDGSIEFRHLRDANTGLPILFDGKHPVDDERRRARADAILIAFWIASGMSLGMAELGYLAVRSEIGRRTWIAD